MTVVIDLKDRTVMPGLIDMHVHVSGESSPGAYSERFFMNPADAALRATVYLRRTLERRFHHRARLGRRRRLGPEPARRHRQGLGAGACASSRRARPSARPAATPTPPMASTISCAATPGPVEGGHQRRRRRPQGRTPALQGGAPTSSSSPRTGGGAEPGGQRREPAIHRDRAQGRCRHREGLRLCRRGACAWQGRHAARHPCWRGQHRARLLP